MDERLLWVSIAFVVVVVLYLLKRRSRLRKDDE
jgi:hypothetical protein